MRERYKVKPMLNRRYHIASKQVPLTYNIAITPAFIPLRRYGKTVGSARMNLVMLHSYTSKN